MGYLASPLWMAQLLVGIVLVLQSHYIRPEYFTKEFSLFPAWPRFDYERALQLFELTIGILLAPKFLGLLLALIDGKTRRGSGGALALIASTFVEIIISAALAPIMMLIQSGSVAQILSGRDTGWNPQRRDDGSIPFSSIARRHRSHALLGVITLFAAALISPSLVVWMSPTIAGLILSIPLSWASGNLTIGLAMRRIGLLRTPEETSPPAVVGRANMLAAELALTGRDHETPSRRSRPTRRCGSFMSFSSPRPPVTGAARSRLTRPSPRRSSMTLRRSRTPAPGSAHANGSPSSATGR